MASLALGVAGAFAGSFFGPVGASIGWSLGAMLGSALDPQKIEGPRLSDLKLQNSSYGLMVPIVYGTVRVAGNVIWQTDLVEHASTEGGKGGPEVTSYSYSASFAIRICEGEVHSIRKIWADSRLVVDNTEGSSIRSLPYTFYTGTETQDVDPTMEAELGVGNVPAYRGTAYVVFTDLDLTEFGNRIPIFSFEVLERGGTDSEIRIHQIVSSNAIMYGHLGDPPNTLRPIILQWPVGDGTIRVVTSGGADVYEYDAGTLSYSTTVPRTSAESWPSNITVDCSAYSNGYWFYHPVGRYISNGGYLDIWLCPSNLCDVSASGVRPSIGAYSLFCGGSGFPETGINIAYNAGIPSGEIVANAAISRDKKSLMLFTAPDGTLPWSGYNVVDKWYRLVDSVVVDSGTVSPAVSGYTLGFGQVCTYGYTCNSLENNGRWLWVSNTSGVSCWRIDDANNLAWYTTGGYEGAIELSDPYDFMYSSVLALQDGYCGAVANDVVAVFTRFPINENLQAPLDEVVSDLSLRAGLTAEQIDVTRLSNDALDGFVLATQGSVRNALEPLMTAFSFAAVESDGKVKFVRFGGEIAATIADDDLGASTSGVAQPLAITSRLQEADLPRACYVNYLDTSLDYQQGTQVAQRQTTSSEKSVTIQMPISMPSIKAKQIVDRVLFLSWLERERFTLSLPRKYEYLEPTDVISARGRRLRIVQKTRTSDRVIKLECVPTHQAIYTQTGAGSTPGSGYTPAPIIQEQQTNLAFYSLPLLRDSDSMNVAYASATPDLDAATWNGAVIFKSSDGGSSYTQLLETNTAGVIGTCGDTLGTFTGGNAFDELNTLSVTLTQGSGTLSSVTELAVLNGANAALIGSEIVQFKNAVLTGTRTYTLSGLLRGRKGTEAYIATHGSSESFVLLSTVTAIPMVSGEVFQTRQYRSVTAGKSLDWSFVVSYADQAQTYRNYTPVHLGGGRNAAGDVILNWVRRVKIGGEWVDYIDVPAAAEADDYQVNIYSSNSYATLKRTATIDNTSSTTWTYTSAMQVADFGANQSTVYWTVGQFDSFGRVVTTRGVT